MFKKIIPKSEFVKNVITLVTGTAISQAIPLAISPILTRIFTPEDFGVFALYLSITSALSVIATGRYEFAITLPAKEEDAIQILWLSCIITFLVSLFFLLVVSIFNSQITFMLGNPSISVWLYLIPITIMFSGIYQSFSYFFNRQRKYTKLSKSKVVQTLSSSTVNVSLGLLSKGGVIGLIGGNIVGKFLSGLYLVYLFFKQPPDNIGLKKNHVLTLGKKYIDFPRFDVAASFFNIASNQSVHIFFNSIFGAVTSGYFYLTQKIFSAPIALIAGSIQDVFKMEMVSLHIAKGNTRKLFLKTMHRLIIMATIPSLLIFIFAKDVFAFVFGEEWRVAGEYARILTPVFFVRFVSFPLSYMFYVAEKQLYNIVGQFILFCCIIMCFVVGKFYDAETTVIFLSIVYTFFYTVYLYIAYKLTTR